MNETLHPSKIRILDAALGVVRAKGYPATRIEDVCAAAGVTKGSFFHHFRGKEDLALAAVDYWTATTGALFAGAPYHEYDDPLDRILGYLDFRKSLLGGTVPEFTCLVGTMVQDVYETDPAIRKACDRCIGGHAATLEDDIGAAMRKYGVAGGWTAASLALHTQAVLQGAFILSKAKGGPEVAADSVDHLRRYVELLFGRPAGSLPPHSHEGAGS